MATPANTRTLTFSATGFEKFCMGLFFYLGIFCLFLGFRTLTVDPIQTLTCNKATGICIEEGDSLVAGHWSSQYEFSKIDPKELRFAAATNTETEFSATTTNTPTIPAWTWLLFGFVIAYFGLRWMLQFQTTLLLDFNNKTLTVKNSPWQNQINIAFQEIASVDIKKGFLLLGNTVLPTLTLSLTNIQGQFFFKRRRPATKKVRLEMAAQLMEIRAALHKHNQN